MKTQTSNDLRRATDIVNQRSRKAAKGAILQIESYSETGTTSEGIA